jgi:hypothetical protein
LCSHSRTSQYFMEPEGSVPCSKEPSNGPYSEPYQSNIIISFYFSKIHFNIVQPPTSWSSQWSLCFYLLLLLLLLLLYCPLLSLGRFLKFSITYRVSSASWTGDQLVANPVTAHRTSTQRESIHCRYPCLDCDSNP